MNNVNIIPKLFSEKEDCCGCTACYSVCSENAINMKVDNEGFLYPEIDVSKCVHCTKCIAICAFKDKKKNNFGNSYSDETFPQIFALKHKDYNVRINSRSGGAFTAISDEVIGNGGVVYGCVMANAYEAVHKRAETYEERDSMRGSKYIQSNLGNTFLMVKNDLLAGRKVLFTGTPCQIDGLKKLLAINYDNLLCIDIVCHGMPSPLIWKSYIKWLEYEYRAKCITENILFRDKKNYGWASHIETIKMVNDNNKNIEINSGIFKELFYSNLILRPACYQCPYTSLYRPGDITIADFWGINDILPGTNDNKGVSMVFINNIKGRNLFDKCKKNTFFYKVKLGKNIQRPLRESVKNPENRMLFWKEFFEKISIKDFLSLIKYMRRYMQLKGIYLTYNDFMQLSVNHIKDLHNLGFEGFLQKVDSLWEEEFHNNIRNKSDLDIITKYQDIIPGKRYIIDKNNFSKQTSGNLSIFVKEYFLIYICEKALLEIIQKKCKNLYLISGKFSTKNVIYNWRNRDNYLINKDSFPNNFPNDICGGDESYLIKVIKDRAKCQEIKINDSYYKYSSNYHSQFFNTDLYGNRIVTNVPIEYIGTIWLLGRCFFQDMQ